MAEGIFKTLVKKKGLENQVEADSSGIIDYHKGNPPDYRMRQTAKKHGILLEHQSRPVSQADFSIFDYILPMDCNNRADLQQLQSSVADSKATVLMMRQFDNTSSSNDVADPYYSDQDGFEECYQVLTESCTNFLAFLIEQHDLQPSE